MLETSSEVGSQQIRDLIKAIIHSRKISTDWWEGELSLSPSSQGRALLSSGETIGEIHAD